MDACAPFQAVGMLPATRCCAARRRCGASHLTPVGVSPRRRRSVMWVAPVAMTMCCGDPPLQTKS